MIILYVEESKLEILTQFFKLRFEKKIFLSGNALFCSYELFIICYYIMCSYKQIYLSTFWLLKVNLFQMFLNFIIGTLVLFWIASVLFTILESQAPGAWGFLLLMGVFI